MVSMGGDLTTSAGGLQLSGLLSAEGAVVGQNINSAAVVGVGGGAGGEDVCGEALDIS